MAVTGNRPLQIANVSGFYGDRLDALAEMLGGATELDVVTGDYLAELTMSILAKSRRRDPTAGHASTFLDQLEANLGTCRDRGIRIVVNAGGLNPHGMADGVRALAERLGVSVGVGVVDGDDLVHRYPDDVVTANAYLGGHGIAACLAAGADVVVTGRVTDAALVLGPAVWWHGWEPTDWDRLAAAVVAGHVLECGPQATGGNYPFIDELSGHAYPGSPIAEIADDATTVITKNPGTGGAVSVGTITAQLLYEIDAPAYANPDVTALFDTIALTQLTPDRVEISGVRGTPPPPQLKVAVNTVGGWRNEMTLVLTGLDIEAKAMRATQMFADRIGGFNQFDDHAIELLQPGVDDAPTNAQATASLRIVVEDADQTKVDRRFSNVATELLLASYAGAFTTTPPGRAREFAVYRPDHVDRSDVEHRATLPDGSVVVIADPPVLGVRDVAPTPSTQPEPAAGNDWGAARPAPLGAVCGARSGDKGGNANVGFWATSPEAHAWLSDQLTIDVLRRLLPEAAELEIERHELPNLSALNFVIHGLLGQGVAASTRFDPQAKGLGEYLRSRTIDIPTRVLGDRRPQRR